MSEKIVAYALFIGLMAQMVLGFIAWLLGDDDPYGIAR